MENFNYEFKGEFTKGLFEYIISDASLKDKIRSVFNLHSIVVDSLNNIKYSFIGNGCGIVWLNIDRRNKKAIKFNDEIYEALSVYEQYLKTFFTLEEKCFFERIGNPIGAVISQDIEIQKIFYIKAVEYAKNVLGIKRISYKAVLD